MPPRGVVFICLGNSCRSIMAEALARHHFQEQVTSASAGISPLGFVARETLQVLAEITVSLAGLRSKGLEDLDFSRYHWAVNLTTYDLEPLLPSTFPGRLLNRPVADPYGRSLDHYRRTREVLQRLITQELQPILLPAVPAGVAPA
ncbi:MAG: low molecular weight phosphatase family protein [Thermodesulfobacteriota bacterium]